MFVRRIVKLAMLAVLTFPGAACHRATSNATTNATASAVRVDTLWYATARQRNGERLSYRFADSLEFGFYRIASKANANGLSPDIDMRVIDSARVTRAKFLSSISAPSKDASDIVVLSVHGYATSHTKAIRDAAEAYLRSGTKARWVAFSWPSSGHGMNLMQPGHAFMTGAYRADSVGAVKSKRAFAKLVLALHETVGGARLVVTTHSLGAQLATETLAGDTLVRAQLARAPLRAIGMFEPDIATKRFRDYTVPRLRTISSRLVLYASRNDGMLRFSRLVNRGDRAGLIDNDDAAQDGVEIVDVTDAPTAEGWIRSRFGTHHAMKKETSALRDFFDVVVAQRSANDRTAMGTALLTASGVWRLLPGVR